MSSTPRSPPFMPQATPQVLGGCTANGFGLHLHGGASVDGMIVCSWRRILSVLDFVGYMPFKFVYCFHSSTIAKTIHVLLYSGSHLSAMSHVKLQVCGLLNPIVMIMDSVRHRSCISTLLFTAHIYFQFMDRLLYQMTYIILRHSAPFVSTT